jgi:hypothetical protein
VGFSNKSVRSLARSLERGGEEAWEERGGGGGVSLDGVTRVAGGLLVDRLIKGAINFVCLRSQCPSILPCI